MPRIMIACREQIYCLYFEVLANYHTGFVMLIRVLVSHSQLFVIVEARIGPDTPVFTRRRFLSPVPRALLDHLLQTMQYKYGLIPSVFKIYCLISCLL